MWVSLYSLIQLFSKISSRRIARFTAGVWLNNARVSSDISALTSSYCFCVVIMGVVVWVVVG
jgi:hypothetical protein